MKRRDFISLRKSGTQGLIGAGVTIASSNVIAKEVLQTQKPNTSFPSAGNKITAKVLSSEIPCTIGMKPGDEFKLGFRKCGDFCGFFYSSIHDSIMSLQFGEMETVRIRWNSYVQIRRKRSS